MNGFVQWMEVKLMPIANKFGSQRHMTAIRKGLIATMPLTMWAHSLQFSKYSN